MRILVAALAVISLSACAARVFQVPLNLLDAPEVKFSLDVKDGRLDKQIYMNGISFGSRSHIYLLTTEPPIEVALARHILNTTSKSVHHFPFTKAEVTVEEIDLKNIVGFGKADELYCKIESYVVLSNNTGKLIERRVKTLTKNEENMSPFITTAAKIILEQCLQQHSLEVVDNMSLSR